MNSSQVGILSPMLLELDLKLDGTRRDDEHALITTQIITKKNWGDNKILVSLIGLDVV